MGVPQRHFTRTWKREIAFSFKKVSPIKPNHTAIEAMLLALVRFLDQFRCFLEGSAFEIISTNPVLRLFFSKPKAIRSEATMLETLRYPGILLISFKPGKIRVLETHWGEFLSDIMLSAMWRYLSSRFLKLLPGLKKTSFWTNCSSLGGYLARRCEGKGKPGKVDCTVQDGERTTSIEWKAMSAL